MKFKRVLYDIETNGLLDTVDKIHCIVIRCLDSGEMISESAAGITEAVEVLQRAEYITGHNILGYDNRVIKKLIGHDWDGKSYDTLTASRLIYAHIKQLDWNNRPKGMPYKLYGRHSLEAWGHRLGCHKDDYDGGWETWTSEMQRYCEQDTEVNLKLYHKLQEWNYSERAIKLEHDFQRIIEWQMELGCPFDTEAANRLRDEVEPEMEFNKKRIQGVIPFIEKSEIFVPKRDNKTLGYKKGVPFKKVHKTPFNPSSRQHIIELLQTKYNWNPVDFTDKKNPKVDREVLEKLTDWEDVPVIMEHFDQVKLAGQLWKGKYSWLNLVKNGRIHGRVITNGAITGRCTHSSPNLAQVPSLRAYKGAECRALFHAPPGFKMVGADASGLELRMLAHYLYPYDGGEFAREVIDGDIHTANQEAAGLPTRDDAKTFIYAFNYGAGDAKLGSIVEPRASDERQRTVGRQLRNRFLARNPAIKRLISEVKSAYRRRKSLRGLDNRLLFPRAEHKALNTLLQSAGAVVMKEATVLFWDAANYFKLPVVPALHIHDEWQVIAEEESAESVGELSKQVIAQAGETLNLNVPLAGEYKIGNNWAETH